MKDSIGAELLSRWGDVELLERAPGGWVNEVHFGRLDGDQCVVRASKESDASLMWELDLVRRVATEPGDPPPTRRDVSLPHCLPRTIRGRGSG